MKSFKFSGAAVLLLAAAMTSGSAFAYHGAVGHHGGHHGSRVGVFIGGPVLGFGYPYYGFPGYGYGSYGGYAPYGGYSGYGGYGAYGPYGAYGQSTTIVTAPAPAPVYVEQGSAAMNGPASDGNWYYCHNPDGYYPYVKQCAENWQRVPAQPSTR